MRSRMRNIGVAGVQVAAVLVHAVRVEREFRSGRPTERATYVVVGAPQLAEAAPRLIQSGAGRDQVRIGFRLAIHKGIGEAAPRPRVGIVGRIEQYPDLLLGRDPE